jgi:alkylhydroperoxidase family enzyme
MPVVRLVEEPEDEELRLMYERMSAGAGPVGGPVPGVLNVFKTVAHNPRLLRAWMRMGTVLLAPGGITLSPRLREIAILRIAQQCGSEYEFAHHIPIAEGVGLSEAEISALQDFAESPHFSELERAVIRYTDALAAMSAGAPDLARELKRWLSDRELVELSFCIGHWGMVARVLVPLEVPVDETLEATLPQEWREWL